ncbi:hypothetical protein Amet_3067 [Alkaliphilus metalliredigens QYMF]|uniref:Uncharacterized protein n=1 Tax=Alkaliphilus metalliredigens (strain QYMF) TaxID=293826 RepID=A6TSN9_ALKMQ|nr:hypothetical protein [Alkaliphilus metalliredigens]ABR49207.1 hypothetical protein Amet_3067 [Alkaliphilus metalliredigens QYMF]
MSKVISLDEYVKQKKKKKQFSQDAARPLWFTEINDGIKGLALKDKDVILENVRYTYHDEYIYFVNVSRLTLEEYTFLTYIKEHIDLEEPFEVTHGVEFSKGYDLNGLTRNDWENIADIIVRTSLSATVDPFGLTLEPNDIADQYEWDTVLVDSTY